MGGFGFTIFTIGYLKKGDLEAERKRKIWGQNSSLSKHFDIRTLGNKQLFV
jgi:hypothetical protein